MASGVQGVRDMELSIQLWNSDSRHLPELFQRRLFQHGSHKCILRCCMPDVSEFVPLEAQFHLPGFVSRIWVWQQKTGKIVDGKSWQSEGYFGTNLVVVSSPQNVPIAESPSLIRELGSEIAKFASIFIFIIAEENPCHSPIVQRSKPGLLCGCTNPEPLSVNLYTAVDRIMDMKTLEEDPGAAMEFARSKSEARKEGLTGIGFKDVAALDPILGEVLEVVEVGLIRT